MWKQLALHGLFESDLDALELKDLELLYRAKEKDFIDSIDKKIVFTKKGFNFYVCFGDNALERILKI